jgi:glycosyltransferase involved in cell wall biosynthesis
MKLSVLICVFNGENYIRQAIESILNQSIKDLELVVVDDGSTDGTQSAIESICDPRIVRQRNVQNLGIVYSRNKALELARGEYLAIQDADDVSLTQRLENQIAYLDANPEIGMVGAYAEVFSEQDKQNRKIRYWSYNSAQLKYSLAFRNIFVHSTIMFKRSAMPNPPYSIAFPVCEDYHFISELSRQHRLYILPKILLTYRLHGSNVSTVQAELIRATSQKIKEQHLNELEIRYSLAELQTHHTLDSALPYSSIRELEQVGDWLTKMQRTAVICADERSAFESVLRNEWAERCLKNSRFGIQTLFIFLRYRALWRLSEHIKIKAVFIAKCLLQQ